MEFNNYAHLKNYCLKIAYNKNYIVSEEEKDTFNKFEKVTTLLNDLEKSKTLKINENFYDLICLYFKLGYFNAIFNYMKYFIRKIEKFYNNEINFYYVVTSLNSMLKLNIEYEEDFIFNKLSRESIFYPSRASVLEIEDATDKIYTLNNYDSNYKNKFGVYFIYDNKGDLAYIGKSSTCLLGRCLQSVKERNLLDFSKIEMRECKSRSDVAIYESYYIGRYKPMYNTDLVFDDNPTIKLPELQVSKTIKRDAESEYYNYYYIYYREHVIDIDDFFNKYDTKKILLNTPENKEFLHRKGILTKYEMRNKAYDECIEDIKSKGKYAVSEITQR